MKKLVLMQKHMNLTSARRAEHPFAGQNTQQNIFQICWTYAAYNWGNYNIEMKKNSYSCMFMLFFT